MALTTPVWQLPYPQEADPADVPLDIKALADKLDTVLSAVRSGAAIPGEVKLWPGGTLPAQASYGHWVWCDGLDYDSATYPKTAAAIATAWRTSFGKPDPGAGRFRVPDLRGVSIHGLDAMPGGARANRTTRAAAINQGVMTGEELHSLATAEMPSHAHGVSDPTHAHGVSDPTHGHNVYSYAAGGGRSDAVSVPNNNQNNALYPVAQPAGTGIGIYGAGTGVSIQATGGGGAHENLPPTAFVPYICKLDD